MQPDIQQQPDTVQQPTVQQPDVQQQPSVQQPAQPAVPATHDKPTISVTSVSGAFFTSPTATITTRMDVTAAAGVAYVNVVYSGPRGQSPQGALLASGTTTSGTWMSSYTIQCSQFRAGDAITVAAEVGDQEGSVAKAALANTSVLYGSIQAYNPDTNTKGSTAYVCP
ncbi:hypothetical protein [Cryobacterium zongtaii]|uniref:hypothetical protein n=1 Tax=Cryobacterium zongtaii TaxID=1259217 RepID=UPI001056F041|nr:hypothetical protein [Cryobacterium zongtaii]